MTIFHDTSCELLVSYFGVNHLFGWRSRHFEYALAAFVTVILTYWTYKCSSNTLPHLDGYLQWCKLIIHFLFTCTYSCGYSIKHKLQCHKIYTFITNYRNIHYSLLKWHVWCTLVLVVQYYFTFYISVFRIYESLKIQKLNKNPKIKNPKKSIFPKLFWESQKWT